MGSKLTEKKPLKKWLNNSLQIIKRIFWIYWTKIWRSILNKAKSLFKFTKQYLLTITAIIIILIVKLFFNVSLVNNQAVLTAIGLIIATILVLTCTLSIIPVQKASETWSPAIARLYRKDQKIRIAFFLLSTFVLLAFIFSIKRINFFVGDFILLGATLDILRWYYVYACSLLDPYKAVSSIESQAKKTINRCEKLVSVNTKHYFRITLEERKKVDQNYVKGFFYHKLFAAGIIENFVDDLTEATLKAINRNEISFVKSSIKAISAVTSYYIKVRTNNLVTSVDLSAEFIPIPKSDIDNTLTHVYEALKKIGVLAVSINDEGITNSITSAYMNIAVALLKNISVENRCDSFFFHSFYYLKEMVSEAEKKGSLDIPFQSIEIVCRTIKNFPKNLPLVLIYEPIVDWFQEIVAYFYGISQENLANTVISRTMFILTFCLTNTAICPPELSKFLEYVLDKFKPLVELVVQHEETKTLLSCQISSSLSSIYDYRGQDSIGQFFQNLAAQITEEAKTGKQDNPYYHFLEQSNIISMHFRSLANRNNFGASSILHNIIHLIKHIISVLFNLIQEPIKEGFEDGLVKEVKAYLSFFTIVFGNKNTSNIDRVKEACNVISYVGLLFSKNSWLSQEIIPLCANCIFSILESYFSTNQEVVPYHVAKCLLEIWYLKVIAEQTNSPFLLNNINSFLEKKPTHANDIIWEKCISKFENEKKQLEKIMETGEPDNLSYFCLDETQQLLLSLLKKKNH